MQKELDNYYWTEVLLILTIASFATIISFSIALNSEITALNVYNVEIGSKHAVGEDFKGKQGIVAVASWYDYNLEGIAWSKEHNTCASRTLKRYSMARVVNLANGKIVDCYVNDWVANPKVEIDLSSHAFAEIADLKLGLIKVKIIQL